MEEKKGKVLQAVLGKAENLSGMVEYSKDAVVSKTLIDKSVGTITLFAFDAGQSLSEHTAPYDAFVEVVDGNGVFNIADKQVKASAGDVLIMPANVPHSVVADVQFKMLLVMIRK